MAKLPEYQQQTEVGKQPTPYQQVDAKPQAFGIGTGLAALHAAEDVDRMYNKIRKEAAEDASSDALLKYGADVDKIEDKFKANAGLAPAQVIGDFEKEIEDLRKKYSGSLKDDMAARLFDHNSRLQTQGVLRRMNDHALKQIAAWERSDYEGVQGRALNQMIPTGTPKADAQTIADNFKVSAERTRSYWEKQGADQKFVEFKVQEHTSSMIEKMLKGYDTNPAKGKELLDSAMPGTDITMRQILGDKAGAWDAHFGKLNEAVEIERKGAEVWGNALTVATAPVTGRVDEAKLRAYFDAQPAEFRAKGEKDFNARVAVAMHLQDKEDIQRVSRAEIRIRATNRLDKKDPDYVNNSDLGRERIEAFWDARQRQLRSDKYEARREQAAINGMALAKLRDAYIANPSVADLSDDDLKVQFGTVAKDGGGQAAVDDFGLKDLQLERSRMKKANAVGQTATSQEFYKRVDNQARIIAGLGGNKSKEQWATRAQKFRDVMAEWFNDGKPHTDAELSAKIKEFVTEYDVPFWTPGNRIGADKYGFDLTPEQREKFKANPDQRFEAAKAKDQLVKDPNGTVYRLKAGFALPKGWTVAGDAP